MSKSYLNKVELMDGQVILFHRTANSKRPIYHMRIHVRGMQDLQGTKLTYIQETTNESNLDQAKRKALNRFDELKQSVREKRPVVELTFNALYALWWVDKKARLEAAYFAKGRTGAATRVHWYEKHSARYWLPYFGSMKISDLNHAFVQAYWPWRMSYWSRADDAERKRFANHAMKPAKKSMDMEQSALREVFHWANSMKVINYTPVIENPYSRQGIAAVRRPSFEESDWQKLRTYMEAWAKGQGKNDKAVNPAHQRQRKLLQCYLHILAYSGLRPGEALKLKHADVATVPAESGDGMILHIHVPKNTKTGERLVRTQHECVEWYEKLKAVTGRASPDDWLFCQQDGKQNTGFYKTLPKMLDEAGLLYDANGARRVAYSLRHYYAEDRLRAMGANPKAIDNISSNMGTQRIQLETHYIRAGMLTDETALIGPSAGRRATASKLAELAKVADAEVSLAKASGPVRLSSVFGGGKK